MADTPKSEKNEGREGRSDLNGVPWLWKTFPFPSQYQNVVREIRTWINDTGKPRRVGDILGYISRNDAVYIYCREGTNEEKIAVDIQFFPVKNASFEELIKAFAGRRSPTILGWYDVNPENPTNQALLAFEAT